MKKFSLLAFVVVFLALGSFAYGAQRLVLHFDVNGTLVALDTKTGKSVEDVLNCGLAERTYYPWGGGETLSYADYLSTIIPEEAARKKLLKRFVADLKAADHPLSEQVEQQYVTLREKLARSDSDVFASFYRLLSFLDREGVEYTVLIRTFGGDLERVVADIEEQLGQPLFDSRARYDADQLYTDLGERLDSHQAYEHFRHHHVAVQDDWANWLEHGKGRHFGKPFPCDPEDAETLCLFFDDNIEEGESPTNIVTPIDARNGQPLAVPHSLFRVDTVEAIQDDDYFIKCVQEALVLQ